MSRRDQVGNRRRSPRLSLARLSLRDAVLQAEAVAPLTATARIAPDLEERE